MPKTRPIIVHMRLDFLSVCVGHVPEKVFGPIVSGHVAPLLDDEISVEPALPACSLRFFNLEYR